MFGRKLPGQVSSGTTPSDPLMAMPATGQPVHQPVMMAAAPQQPMGQTQPSQVLRMPETRIPLMQMSSAMPTNSPSTQISPQSLNNPRRNPDMIAPRSNTAPRQSQGNDYAGERRLTVGRDITLTGEIASCDVLMVEGQIEATMKDSKLIEVAEAGTFRGVAEVEQAKIAGRYEGDLIVRGRLTVAETGRIVGTVRYGELEVLPGGQIVGEMQMNQPTASATPMPAAATGLRNVRTMNADNFGSSNETQEQTTDSLRAAS